MSTGFKARDLNALVKSRTHTFPAEMVGAHEDLSITFEPGKWHDVPRVVAMRLAAIEGFEVRDAKDRMLKIAPTTTRTLTAVTLASDETIAKFDELSDQALRARVVRIVGAESVGKLTRDDSVSILVEASGKPASDDDAIEANLQDRAA